MGGGSFDRFLQAEHRMAPSRPSSGVYSGGGAHRSYSPSPRITVANATTITTAVTDSAITSLDRSWTVSLFKQEGRGRVMAADWNLWKDPRVRGQGTSTTLYRKIDSDDFRLCVCREKRLALTCPLVSS